MVFFYDKPGKNTLHISQISAGSHWATLTSCAKYAWTTRVLPITDDDMNARVSDVYIPPK
jgi:hypothetical protein